MARDLPTQIAVQFEIHAVRARIVKPSFVRIDRRRSASEPYLAMAASQSDERVSPIAQQGGTPCLK